jgi:hypothetical protein
MKQVLVSYEQFDARDMADAEHMLEQIRNKIEGMLYYIRDEAELDVCQLDDYRIDLGDIGDEVFALKQIMAGFTQNYRTEIYDALTEDLELTNIEEK